VVSHVARYSGQVDVIIASSKGALEDMNIGCVAPVYIWAAGGIDSRFHLL